MSSSTHESASPEPTQAQDSEQGPYKAPPQSIFKRRLAKFRRLKRGYYSFLLLIGLYLVSFFNPFLINNRAIMVGHEGKLYFPTFKYYEAKIFGQKILGETKYRDLKKQFEREDEGNWVLMPPYPYHPNESLLLEPELRENRPIPRVRDTGSAPMIAAGDVFARITYAYRISITFSLAVVILAYSMGVTVGSILGYFGAKVDILGQRFVEIWSALPFLYTMIIVSSLLRPSIPMFVLLLAVLRWSGMSFYIRGEFYREKAKDYVAAAIAQGESSRSVMFRHILPNALTPLVSFAPFAMVGYISTLVSLDFLGFGLPAPTPSWGEMVGQGLGNINDWHLVFFPLAALFGTLIMVVFIGEAVREAFDPRAYSRLR